MDVRCEQCGTEYEFDQNRVGPNGVTVKCTNCGNVFKVHRPDRRRRPIPRASTTVGAGPEGREWLVRRPDRQMIAFRELTTLQKWIVEGRIGREDEISKNGETWKRLGNISELEPFFSVYEKAQALTRMIDQGAIIPPVPTRGSDVLPSFQAEPPEAPLDALARLTGDGPRSAPTSSLGHRPLSGISERPVPPPPPPPTSLSVPAHSPPVSPSARPVHPRVADARPVQERMPVSGPAVSPMQTGLPGPGALEPEQQPAAFGTTSLDMPEQVVGNDVVDDFRRSRRRKQWAIAAAVLLFLGIGVGAGLAAYGPRDNPVRVWATRYGIRRAPAPTNSELEADLAAATQALDRDTEASRRESMAILAIAHRERPTDVRIPTWRAFGAAISALSAQQKIEDLREASDAEIPRVIATERATINRLVGQASEWLRLVPDSTPAGRDILLARAAVALAQGKEDLAQRALAKIAESRAEHSVDPLWLHLSAASVVRGNAPTPDALRQAETRLRTAVTARPTLIRAHVLLARLLHQRGETEQAWAIVDDVLKREATHEEAGRLKRAWGPPKAAPPKAQPPKARPPKAPPKVASKPPPPQRTFEDWMRIGNHHRERDRTSAALNAYGRAAELRPDDPDPQVGKGWCLLDLGKPKVALVAFRGAQKVDPENAEAFYGLAETYREIGNAEKALTAYRAYLSRAPETPERRAVERQIAALEGR